MRRFLYPFASFAVKLIQGQECDFTDQYAATAKYPCRRSNNNISNTQIKTT
jgi:hypothetical protein